MATSTQSLHLKLEVEEIEKVRAVAEEQHWSLAFTGRRLLIEALEHREREHEKTPAADAAKASRKRRLSLED